MLLLLVMGGSGTNGFIFKSVKNMKRVDIIARAFLFKGQGPKMLTGYYKYWRKHDIFNNYSTRARWI